MGVLSRVLILRGGESAGVAGFVVHNDLLIVGGMETNLLRQLYYQQPKSNRK